MQLFDITTDKNGQSIPTMSVFAFGTLLRY